MRKYSSNSSENEVLNKIKEKICIGVFNIKTCLIKNKIYPLSISYYISYNNQTFCKDFLI